MTHLIEIRERLIKFYQNHARIIVPIFRFVLSLITFFSVSQLIGYSPLLKPWYVIVSLSVVSAVLPASALLVLAAIYAVLHLRYVSLVLALVLALIFLIVYLVYIRFLPEHGFVILAVPVLYALRLPYIVPIVLGLVAAPIALIPMSCGVICYFTLQDITTVVGTATEDSVVLFNQAIHTIFSDQKMYLAMAIFAVVMIVVNVIRNYEFHYAFETAIVVGAILSILLFLGTSFAFDVRTNVVSLLVETLISAGVAWVIQFFRLVLNYSAVEYLQFEDDEYYYYVKAVPKINIAMGEKQVKRFNAHLLGGSRFGINSQKPEEDVEDVEGQQEITEVPHSEEREK